MRHVQFSYQLEDAASPEARLRNPLIDLLYALRTGGSISAAAGLLGFSYRHVWGQLKHWENLLGRELVVWERGQAAVLTPFGEKLLWTERLAQARLAPQIETLRAELERTLALAYDDSSHVLTLYGSHDDALPRLQAYAGTQAQLHLTLQFCGSVDAIRALNEGRCVVAGFHAREQPGVQSPTGKAYKPLLRPGQHKLLAFAQRRQGLIVPSGNPRRLQRLADVARWRLRFVHRPAGTGTRLLLEELLEEAGLPPDALNEHGRTEPSHAAVAQAIASGAADTGLGTESAAQRLGLGFVPLAEEHYHLACLKSALDQPAVMALRQVLGSAGWQRELQAIAGYSAPAKPGQVRSLKAALPWWQFAQKPSAKKPLSPPPGTPD